MTVQPGQPLTISCKVSYSITSLHTAWIRQPAGKTLEWIGYIHNSLKNKFSISKDPASSIVTLTGQSLQTEDTAVYYCARIDIQSLYYLYLFCCHCFFLSA
uniref:Ig-like domain-containing protein n=1 Tax=Hucho hucho TaxID=62062 RepID=A0A4W5MNS9_9TELE